MNRVLGAVAAASAAIIGVGWSAVATAQVFDWVSPGGQAEPPAYYVPQTRNTYDWQTGNSYTTTRRASGGTSINGYNVENGSTWHTEVDRRGNMHGTDADGNYWTYDRRSGAYFNGNGASCYGTGALRTCN
jgi:hypothetical protein